MVHLDRKIVVLLVNRLAGCVQHVFHRLASSVKSRIHLALYQRERGSVVVPERGRTDLPGSRDPIIELRCDFPDCHRPVGISSYGFFYIRMKLGGDLVELCVGLTLCVWIGLRDLPVQHEVVFVT